MNECLWLVWHGVPFDVAFLLPPSDRFAWSVIFGQFEGNKWDFKNMRWKKED